MKSKITSLQMHGLTVFNLIIFMTICSVNLFSQNKPENTITKDTLTWYVYIDGKPYMKRVMAEKMVADKWGIKMEIFTGNCAGTFNYKEKEFQEKNRRVFEYLKIQYGTNWSVKFDKEVEEMLKRMQTN